MKKNLYLLITLMLLISMLFVPVSAEQNIKVILNGTELKFDEPAKIINDRTLVPMRGIFEALGATVEWHEDTQLIIVKKDDIRIEMQINKSSMIKNKTLINLDIAPMLINGRTFVPLRAISESLWIYVNWDEPTQSVFLVNNLSGLDKLNSREDVFNYIAKNYSTVKTLYGNYELITWSDAYKAYIGIGVGKNDSMNTPYDYCVNIDFSNAYRDYMRITDSISYTEQQKDEFKNCFSTYQYYLAKDLFNKLPGKKIRGGFLIDGYEYPSIQKGKYNYYFFGWKNYTSVDGSSTYNNNILNNFMWFNFTERFTQ